MHCGGCNQACGDGEICFGGACGLQCLGGTTKCGDKCADKAKKADGCGSCSKAKAEAAKKCAGAEGGCKSAETTAVGQ